MSACLLLLLLGAGGWWAGLQRWHATEAAHRASLANCRSDVAAGLERLARYRQASEGDPRRWFETFSREVAQRTFLARLALRWHSDFELNDQLQGKETLLNGRKVKEENDLQRLTTASAGFLLGRRSNLLFGLIMVSRSDRGLAAPEAWFTTPPPKARIDVPWGFDRFPSYTLKSSSVQVGVEVLEGCQAGASVSIVHAWRTNDYFALVIGCEASLGGTDLPLFPYEGFRRFVALSERELAFPSMTPAGGVAISWVCLDRKFGEPGMSLRRIGMPSSIGATFLPVEEGMTQPVLHSLIFHLDERTERWVPFWAVRKQLASAQDVFDLAATLDLPFTLITSPSTAPELRKKMLRSFQNLINLNEEHVSAGVPEPQIPSPPCSSPAADSL